MIQKQKGFSAPVLALSVWTAALAEEMQTGISPRGMIIHGAVQALLLTCISGVFSACWQRAAMQWVWLFSAGAWFLAELFGTVMQAQNICQQEFRSSQPYYNKCMSLEQATPLSIESINSSL